MSDKSNREICDDFRSLLTTQFNAVGIDRDEALRATRDWRNELWRAFREIEDRLCPLDALARERNDNA